MNKDTETKEYNKTKEFTLSVKGRGFKSEAITSSAAAAKYARKFYHEDIAIYESVFILMLDRQNKTLGYAKISQGGICGTVVDVRIVAKYAIDSLASSVIFVHNHPSGANRPSRQDIEMSERIKKCLELFDIRLVDSIILAPDEGYYSMADECQI